MAFTSAYKSDVKIPVGKRRENMEEGSLEEWYLDQVSGVFVAVQASEPKPRSELRVLCPQGLCPQF